MDFLCKVYGGTSDEEDDNGGIQLQRPILRQPKRAKLENFNNPLVPAQTSSLPGRYVSKRERAAMASVAKVPESSTTAASNSSTGFVTAPLSFSHFYLKWELVMSFVFGWC